MEDRPFGTRTTAALGRWKKRLDKFMLHERLEGRPRFRARKTAFGSDDVNDKTEDGRPLISFAGKREACKAIWVMGKMSSNEFF